MCESTVFLKHGNEIAEFMKEATRVWLEGTDVVCRNILGETKTVRNALILEANTVGHRIVIQTIEAR